LTLKAALTLLGELRVECRRKTMTKQWTSLPRNTSVWRVERICPIPKLVRCCGLWSRQAQSKNGEALLRTGKRYRRKASFFARSRIRSNSRTLAIDQDRKKSLWKQELTVEQIVIGQDGQRDLQQSPLTVRESIDAFLRAAMDRCNAELRTTGRRRGGGGDF